MDGGTESKRGRGLWIVVVASAWALSYLHARHFNHTCDDAYISFRYARNLVEGVGLVYNPGERVMGYSNFLWVMLLAAARALGVEIPAASRCLGVLFTWATLAWVGRRLWLWGVRPALGAMVLGLLVANGTLALWMLGGLEGPLFMFLLVAAVDVAWSSAVAPVRARFAFLGVMLGLAALTRPEGVFYSVPICGWLLLRALLERRVQASGVGGGPSASRTVSASDLRPVLSGVMLSLGIAATCYLALTAWMVGYYGDPVPNTYYAKAHPLSFEVVSRGWLFMHRFLQAYHWVPLGILVGWGLVSRLSWRSRGWLPLSVLAAFAVFFLVTGGDALVYYRMWLWTLPMFVLLAAEAFHRLAARRRWRVVVWAAGVAGVGLTLPNSWIGEDAAYLRADDRFLSGVAVIGRTLDARTPEETLIAANNIGVLGYWSRRPILDMLGLTDRHIARAPGKPVATPGHESHDGGYVLARAPDLVFLGMPRVLDRPARLEERPPRLYPSDIDLIRDPRFRRNYTFRNLHLPDGRYAPVFVRNGFSY